MFYSLSKKVVVWTLIITLCVTMLPQMSFVEAKTEKTKNTQKEKVNNKKSIDPKNVTEDDVISDELTEDTTTFDLGGGKKKTLLHGGAVRYKDENGNYVDYDPALVKIPNDEKSINNNDLDGYEYKTKSGDKINYIPENLSEETPILLEYEGYELSFSPATKTVKNIVTEFDDVELEDETLPEIYEEKTETASTKAIYLGDNENIKYEYISGDNGIKENIVLDEIPDTNVFKYELYSKGMYPVPADTKDEVDNGIWFLDKKTDKLVCTIASPYMNDATEKAYSEDLEYTIKPVKGKKDYYTLTLTADKDYLNDTTRVYPVTIDPTATWKGSSQMIDTYICSGTSYKNNNYYDKSNVAMLAGKHDTYGITRTYTKHLELKNTVAGKSIASANLILYESSASEKNVTITANTVLEYWNENKVNWSNRASFTSALGSFVTSGTTHAKKTLNITSFVKGLADNTLPNYGVIIKASNEAGSIGRFLNSRHSSTAYRPSLSVVYYDKPTAPTSVTVPKYVNITQNGTITFGDAGNNSTASVSKYQYRIAQYTPDGSLQNANYKGYSTATSGMSIPALDDGYKYVFYVRAVDINGFASGDRASSMMICDKTNPTIVSTDITNYGWNDPCSKYNMP